jgi:hypothetical protein
VSAPRAGEPLYTLDQAARMAGFTSPVALRVYLHRHPDAAEVRYRDKKFDKRCPRLLSLSEIHAIAEKAVK